MASKIPDIIVGEKDQSVNPRMLRREGRLPATVYGGKKDPVSISLDKKGFTYLFNTQVLNLVTLDKNGEKVRALVKNIQTDPITSEILNIEFLRVSDDQKITLNILITTEGESPAFKKGGTLYQMLDEIAVECLPGDIPETIVVDLTEIEEPDTAITIADLKLPSTVTPAMPPETTVLRITSAKGADEEADESSAGVSAEPVAATAD